MAPPKKSALPKPLPEGFILTDTEKKTWRLGKILGQGGFGLIYLASRDVGRPVTADTDFVIKVEYQENGPLFSELKFYQRAAKAESMEKWKRSKKLDFLGIPTYWGTGQAEHNELRYRFMAMDRLGSDLQKVCEHNGGRLKKDTVLQLGQGLVNVLEYIHDNEYVHADIKAANLMLGYRDPEQVYLADYGLSYRYCPDGIHKEYKENPKKGHNGTIEYTSLDAHKGLAPSRRGDLQILGFCLLHWLCGSLPWDKVLKYPVQVQEAKARLMDNLPGSVQQLSVSGASTDEVATFLLYVKTLGYQEKPDYERLRKLLATKGAGRLDFSVPQGFAGGSTSTNIQDPPTMEKKAGRPRGRPKAKAVAREEVEEEEEDVKEEEEEGEGEERSKPTNPRHIRGPPRTKPPAQSKAGRGRGASKAKAREVEDDDDDEVREEGGKKKSKPNTPSRGRPPRSKPSLAQMKEEGLPAVGRSLRPRTVVTYEDYCSAEEEEEEEEEDRPRPVDPCYIRGPPLSPRDQSKQTTRSKWTGKKMDHLCVTSVRQEWEPYLETTTTYKRTHYGNRDHRHMLGNRDEWGERMLSRRADCDDSQWLDSDCGYKGYGNGFEDWDRRSCGTPQQEVHSVQRKELVHWFVYVSFFLILGFALGVYQSVLKPM